VQGQCKLPLINKLKNSTVHHCKKLYNYFSIALVYSVNDFWVDRDAYLSLSEANNEGKQSYRNSINSARIFDTIAVY
jgi:hypothetical protein